MLAAVDGGSTELASICQVRKTSRPRGLHLTIRSGSSEYTAVVELLELVLHARGTAAELHETGTESAESNGPSITQPAPSNFASPRLFAKRVVVHLRKNKN